jgi:branched-chain amino acid transport system substrate-binding protein
MNNNKAKKKTVTISIKGESDDNLSIELDIRYTESRTLASEKDIPAEKIPAFPDALSQAYEKWKTNYLSWGNNCRYWQDPNPKTSTENIESPTQKLENENHIRTIKEATPTHSNVSDNVIATKEDCNKCEIDFAKKFNNWLDEKRCLELVSISRELMRYVIPQDYKDSPELLSFIIQIKTNNDKLRQKLQKQPWSEWKLIQKYYKNSAVMLSTNIAPAINRPNGRLKALVIIGRYEKPENKIDTQIDLTHLKENLDSVLDLEIWPKESEDNSKSALLDKLRDSASVYHLIFFSGHSSEKSGIHLNDKEYISIDDRGFKDILIELRERGLMLAFFNSCDGLKLATFLASAGIPYVLVMKELVYDLVAQSFIKHFLREAVKPEVPIHIAFNEARRKLQRLSGLPNGDFLPALFQNPEQAPFCINPHPKMISKHRQRTNKYLKYLIAAVAVFTIVICIAYRETIITKIWPPKTQDICRLISQNKYISCGDKVLLAGDEGKESKEKSDGFKAIKGILNNSITSKADVDLLKATIEKLQMDWDSTHDPETLIGIENAKIFLRFLENPKTAIKNIAVVIPTSGVPRDIPPSILNGVAFFQHQHNRMNKNNDWDLRVIIVDDNNPENSLARSKENAGILVNQKDILGIIGPYSSKDAIPSIKEKIYQDLLLISPTATSDLLTHKINDGILFNRITPSSETSAKKIVEEWVVENRKIAIFYADGPFSQSLRKSFKKALSSNKKYQNQKIEDIIVDEFLLKKSDTYNSIKSKLEKTKANAIVLLPDAYIYSTKENQIFQQVLTANKGNKPILANSSVYDFFNNNYQNKSIPISQDMYKNLAIVVPWDYSNTKTKLRPEDDPIELPGIPKWWLNERPIDLLSQRTVMAYDASVVMSDILYHANNRSDVIKEITNPKFRSKGITGDITFDGSDRHEDTTSLITPDCKDNQCNGLFKPYVKK